MGRSPVSILVAESSLMRVSEMGSDRRCLLMSEERARVV